jgi:glycerol-3-phosphate acyltransferase PlsY
MLTASAVLLTAYLVGSIPSGYLLVRWRRGLDVREHGSHNVGAINVCRVGGPALGLVTLAADAGKALAMVVFANAITDSPPVVAGAGLLVMVGHAFSIWFWLAERRFSEGKSVACGLGLLVGLACVGEAPWYVPAGPVLVWAAGLVGPRILTGQWQWISPATMAAAVSVPLFVSAAKPAPGYVALSLALAVLVLVRHRNNIRRLRAGTEPKLGDRLRSRQEAANEHDRASYGIPVQLTSESEPSLKTLLG